MEKDNSAQYVSLINEIIAKQSVILGPEIALLKAKNVSGIIVSAEGKVVSVEGDVSEKLKELVDQYVALSGQIVKTALSSVFTKYPSIGNME